MSGLEVIIPAVGAAISAVGSIAGGAAQNKQAKYRARILDQQAAQERAAANREAMRKREEAERVLSDQQAAAAASGGTATDPTILNIIGDTAGEGAVQAEELQYGGEVRATDLTNQAAAVRYAGKQAKSAGIMKAVGTIATGGASLYDKLNEPEVVTRYGASGVDEYGRPVRSSRRR
jgi:hypothetical protein